MARAEALLGIDAVGWSPVENRIASPNERWLIRLADGGGAFAKASFDEESADWIRAEYLVYSSVEAAFLPRLLGFEDGEQPVLVIEDLSAAAWSPPWTGEALGAVRMTLAELATLQPPAGLPLLDEDDAWLTGGWSEVADDPAPFLALGLCSEAWLDAALPVLLEAAAAARLGGHALVHLDARSDNLCVRDGTALLVDWNHARRGNPLVDAVFFATTLPMEGGPSPHELVPPGTAPELVALDAGFFAARAGLPSPPWGPRLRRLQRGQLEAALPWAAAELGLPVPL